MLLNNLYFVQTRRDSLLAVEREKMKLSIAEKNSLEEILHQNQKKIEVRFVSCADGGLLCVQVYWTVFNSIFCCWFDMSRISSAKN
jgi:hypothetical protein